MQIQLDINYEQILQLVKKLPKSQWNKLKKEMDASLSSDASNSELETFLINAPTFTKKQLSEINEATKKLEAWREK